MALGVFCCYIRLSNYDITAIELSLDGKGNRPNYVIKVFELWTWSPRMFIRCYFWLKIQTYFPDLLKWFIISINYLCLDCWWLHHQWYVVGRTTIDTLLWSYRTSNVYNYVKHLEATMSKVIRCHWAKYFKSNFSMMGICFLLLNIWLFCSNLWIIALIGFSTYSNVSVLRWYVVFVVQFHE